MQVALHPTGTLTTRRNHHSWAWPLALTCSNDSPAANIGFLDFGTGIDHTALIRVTKSPGPRLTRGLRRSARVRAAA